ncbi:MAG TPA: alpha-amylase family glycosyl hydrolase, partial [Candidatus Saccharimonadales bacterium]|nr:alpha-amylase family glycosyl hydrolase [Candidatus Saccharimonadales bacterium]
HAITSYAFGNHDNPRIVTRLGEEDARSAAVLQMTLPGMAIIYYGDEIGMRSAELPADAIRDTYYKSRDPERTPMQWSAASNAGFSHANQTWLPVDADYPRCNVEMQQDDPGSFYNLYRKLILLRTTMPALRYGAFVVLEVQNPNVLCFVRTEKDERCIVLMNFSDQPASCVPGIPLRKLLLSSKLETELTDLAKSVDGHIELLPHEAALFM